MRSVQFVLIIGLTGDAEHWNPSFLEKLRGIQSGSDVIRVDLPGAGGLYRETAPLTMRENVESLRKQVFSQGHEGPFVLVAESMGGMVAINWAHDYPQEIAGLALMNTSLGAFSPVYQRLRPGSYAELLKAAVARPQEIGHKMRFNFIINNKTQYRQRAQELADICLKRPQEMVNTLRQAFSAGTFFSSKKNAPKVPMLLMVGAGDRLVNPECTLQIHKHWGGSLVVHPTGGHMLSMDDENWCVDAINDWISQKNIG